jgi:hypothetical protein
LTLPVNIASQHLPVNIASQHLPVNICQSTFANLDSENCTNPFLSAALVSSNVVHHISSVAFLKTATIIAKSSKKMRQTFKPLITYGNTYY